MISNNKIHIFDLSINNSYLFYFLKSICRYLYISLVIDLAKFIY